MKVNSSGVYSVHKINPPQSLFFLNNRSFNWDHNRSIGHQFHLKTFHHKKTTASDNLPMDNQNFIIIKIMDHGSDMDLLSFLSDNGQSFIGIYLSFEMNGIPDCDEITPADSGTDSTAKIATDRTTNRTTDGTTMAPLPMALLTAPLIKPLTAPPTKPFMVMSVVMLMVKLLVLLVVILSVMLVVMLVVMFAMWLDTNGTEDGTTDGMFNCTYDRTINGTANKRSN